MDEIKQGSEIDNALRRVAKQRDRLLTTAPALSPERRMGLTGFLAASFPVEKALRDAAARRDQLLHPHPPKIAMPAASALHRQLLAAEAVREGAREGRALDSRISVSMWRRIFRSPLGAILMGCAMITAALLCLGQWETSWRPNSAENFPQVAAANVVSGPIWDGPAISRAELFSRRIAVGPFNLNTGEPASLEASFVAISRIRFADDIETPLGLRLDLPVRATLMEDGLARTP